MQNPSHSNGSNGSANPTNGSALPTSGSAARPLRVAVLVDLERNSGSGGHVKSWEHFAEAAARLEGQIDLSVHFLGREAKTEELSPSVRYVTHRPVFGTRLFDRLEKMPGHTDLAPHTSKLIPHLQDRDVIHTTDTWFAQARTAMRFARQQGIPLVNSLHTDVPSYTRIFLEDLVHKVVGRGAIASLLLDRWRLDRKAERYMLRQRNRYLHRCRWVLASNREDLEAISKSSPRSRCSLLRRGIDKATFHPAKRDRARLQEIHGISAESFILLFVGRIDAAKNADTAARAARILVDRGAPVHMVFAGDGAMRRELQKLLGPRATFLGGGVPQKDLAWIYASSDLFVFPSETEIHPNVVLEAKACGLPVLISARGGSAEQVTRPGEDGFVLEEGDPGVWADAIAALMRNPERLRRVGAESRRYIEEEWPSWEEVFLSEIMPVWVAVSGRPAPSPELSRRGGAVSPPRFATRPDPALR